MLPASELSRLRADMNFCLTETCDIYEATLTTDAVGGAVKAWTVKYRDVPCRMDQRQGRENNGAGGYQYYTKNIVSLPVMYAIMPAERILYGGNYYNVVSVNEGSGLAITRATVERV